MAATITPYDANESRGYGLARYSAQNRELNRRAQDIVNKARLDNLRVDAIASVTANAMERVSDVDSYRRAIAGGDEFLNAQLGAIEMNFIATCGRVVRGF